MDDLDISSSMDSFRLSDPPIPQPKLATLLHRTAKVCFLYHLANKQEVMIMPMSSRRTGRMYGSCLAMAGPD
jgi:hypothetical protein